MSSARFIVGIDLGTTNTAVATVDTKAASPTVEVFDVPQLSAPGELASRRQLPSFLYIPGEHDLSPAETSLPWDPDNRLVIGELARAQGARVASRMIASAKSWLCHAGVDRSAPILPWGTGGDSDPDAGGASIRKMSPVEASARILGHVRAAWQYRHPEHDIAEQEVIVTVPASFDEAARELTVTAAADAGLGDIVALEEPQAAFYAWIDSHPPAERARLLSAGDHVLVFDIGGGTTDFTLIRVGEDGTTFERTAVGDHLLLGGDNIDLTLAKQVEVRLTKSSGKKLDLLQWHGLVHSCRLAKETLLTDDDTDVVAITVAGRGSKLIGGSLKDQITRDELAAVLDEGFFPHAQKIAQRTRASSGLVEFGLPYASDPAVTRHLGHFLARHADGRDIDAILFNGGAMTPASLRARVLELIASWQGGDAPTELANELPELAVAKGAAYYGLVRRGLGARIRGGTPRSYYVGVGAARGDDSSGPMAVCVADKGLEEGNAVTLERDFEITTNRPVSFKLYSSTTGGHSPGDLVPIGDGRADTLDDGSDLLELPPIVTVLRARGRSRATVRLEVQITELGALEIYCLDTEAGDESLESRWRLSFDMRAGGATKDADAKDPTGELPAEVIAAQKLVVDVFEGNSDIKPTRLIRELEDVLGARRDEWNMTTTRALFDAAFKVEDDRKRTGDHEARWLNLTGFCLRPGKGAPLDEWRVKQMWRIFNDNLQHPKSDPCRLAWWVTWRRIAGGLTAGQQEQIYDRLAQLFLPSAKQKKKWHSVKPSRQEAAEMWRALGNLERLPQQNKIKLCDELVRRLESKKNRAETVHAWALGRLGGRVPLYGPLNEVVPASAAANWLEQLLEMEWPAPEKTAFALAQLGRRTGDRSRDIPEPLRERLAEFLRGIAGAECTAMLVEQVVELEAREERVALGDSLPPGLRLTKD